MWKLLFLIALILTPAQILPATVTASLPHLMNEEPPYAKWGTVAMKETKERYPNANIVDYLHIGRDTQDGQTTEKFKLWLRGEDREFGVFVSILFETASEDIIEIEFEETDR